jgi:hypothetical protein
MSIKMKRMSDYEKSMRKANKAKAEDDYLNSLNNIAMQRDLKERFGEYDEDVSVGDMYQRKKKSTKSKTKRAKKKKGCGCK